MVASIVHQSIDIRLKICGDGMPAKITASCELCALCGRLCKMYNLPFPQPNTTSELKEYVLSQIQPKDDKTQKLIYLLSSCQKENEQMIPDWIDTLKYGYDATS